MTGMAEIVDPGPPSYAYPYPAVQPDRFSRLMARIWARTPGWAAPLGIFTCFVGAGAYVLATDPTDGGVDALPTCFLKLTTGFDCPGCGGTRAFWYVLHGNLPAAARHHALFLFALPFLVYLYLVWAGREMFRWRLPVLRLTPRTIGVFLAVWTFFAVLRNLPWAPFTWLYV